jgi:hypothetical protein
MKEGDEHKLAFLTRYGLCEPFVMQFREALDRFASANLNDILIYSNSIEEHEEHVKWIMERLLEAGL